MNYTLHQLQIFLKVVQTKSITKASEALYMTQPAVSIQIKNLQDQFDIPLTEVIGRKLYVTDFGLEIAALAEKVVQEVAAINNKTLAYQGLLSGKLVISSASTGKYVIPYFLSSFLTMHPGIDLVLDVTNKARVVDSLVSNDIDFAVVSVLPDNLTVNEELLIENKLYMVGKSSDLPDEAPLIYREQGSATRVAMEKYFADVKNKQRKRFELTSNEAVKQAVIAGLGYSIIPLIGMQNELLNHQLHIIPIEGMPITTKWRLIWLKNKRLSPVSSAYLAFLQASKQQILKHNFQWFLNF